jgi:hypothetical protein
MHAWPVSIKYSRNTNTNAFLQVQHVDSYRNKHNIGSNELVERKHSTWLRQHVSIRRSMIVVQTSSHCQNTIPFVDELPDHRRLHLSKQTIVEHEHDEPILDKAQISTNIRTILESTEHVDSAHSIDFDRFHRIVHIVWW